METGVCVLLYVGNPVLVKVKMRRRVVAPIPLAALGVCITMDASLLRARYLGSLD